MSSKKYIYRVVAKVFRRLHELVRNIAERDLPAFANKPNNLRIELPRRIANADCMHIGDNVSLGPGALLIAQTFYPSEVMQHPHRPVPLRYYRPSIKIGSRVTSTGLLTVTAMQSVTIGDDVMFALNVLVADGMHGFETTDVPYKYQPMGHIAPVIIEQGCWIGQNVVIMPGVTIGEMSIIGANSVVTTSVPSRAIAVGAPARVVKHWDEARQDWVAVGQGAMRSTL